MQGLNPFKTLPIPPFRPHRSTSICTYLTSQPPPFYQVLVTGQNGSKLLRKKQKGPDFFLTAPANDYKHNRPSSRFYRHLSTPIEHIFVHTGRFIHHRPYVRRTPPAELLPLPLLATHGRSKSRNSRLSLTASNFSFRSLVLVQWRYQMPAFPS